MKQFIYILAASTLLFACSKPEASTLEEKKKELELLNKEIADLQSKAKTLEMEILEMDSQGSSGKLVATEILQLAPFESFVSLEGVVDAEESTLATAQAPGLVTQVLVKVGQQVSKGQVLAVLDMSTLNKSKAELKQQLSFATTVFEKQARLWEQGIGTELQYLNAKNQMEALSNSLATLEAQMDLYRIKSPISGSVEVSELKVGQSVAPGMPLFRIVNLSSSKIKASVAESYSNLIKPGAQVMIQFPDISSDWHSAQMDFVSKFIDPMNRTFGVEIRIKDAALNRSVKPNMIAKLRISEYKNNEVFTVPTNCIQYSENDAYIVLADQKGKQGIARICTVKTGKSSQGRTEILSGMLSDSTQLQAGAAVITAGFQELNDEQFIEISPR